MGFEQGQQFSSSPRKGKKESFRTILILFFLVLLGALAFFAFSDKISFAGNITGNFIRLNSLNEEKAFDVSVRLEEVNGTLELNEEIDYITLDTKNSNGKLVVNGKLEIPLSEIKDSKIILEAFEGKISLDKNSVLFISGEVGKLSINQIPFSVGEGKIKISISEPLNYEKLSLSNVYLRKYEGKIIDKIEVKGKTFFDLNGEPVKIEKFKGDLDFGNVGSIGVISRGLEFKGLAEEVKLMGDLNLNFRS